MAKSKKKAKKAKTSKSSKKAKSAKKLRPTAKAKSTKKSKVSGKAKGTKKAKIPGKPEGVFPNDRSHISFDSVKSGGLQKPRASLESRGEAVATATGVDVIFTSDPTSGMSMKVDGKGLSNLPSTLNLPTGDHMLEWTFAGPS